MVTESRFRGTPLIALGVAVLCAPSLATVAPITSVSSYSTAGPRVTQNGLAGAGNSGFAGSQSYTLQYGGRTDVLDTITVGNETLRPLEAAHSRVELRRSDAHDRTLVVWQSGSTNGSNAIHLDGTPLNDVNALFSVPSLTRGLDNVFANRQDHNDNFANIERIDVIFDGGLTVTESLAFAIFDRGVQGRHDGFKIAGINALSNGVPSQYGKVHEFASGTWGNSTVVSATSTTVLRQNDPSSPFNPTIVLNQEVGGVLIKSPVLASIGSTIYGYSLFAPDVFGSGINLLDWTNSTVYRPDTSGLTEVARGGGLDLASASAMAFISSTPEPHALLLMAVSACLCLARRRGTSRKA